MAENKKPSNLYNMLAGLVIVLLFGALLPRIMVCFVPAFDLYKNAGLGSVNYTGVTRFRFTAALIIVLITSIPKKK